MTKKVVFDDREKDFIRQNAPDMKDAILLENLQKLNSRIIPMAAMRRQRVQLGIVKTRGRGVCRVAGEPAPTTEPQV